MYPQKEFCIPSKIITGTGCIDKVGEEILKLGVKRALIVTDANLIKVGVLDVVEESLSRSQLGYAIFKDIPTEPTVENVNEGIQSYKVNRCDCILAVGGGSAIDTAKAVSVMLTNEGDIVEYMGNDKLRNRGVPLVAVPTTAGTGSEVTKFTIIADATKEVKMLIGSIYLIPQIAFADPLLTVTMPKELTAATGIDALCHAIEAYVSLKACPISDIFAISAIELLSVNLRKAWANGNNLEARDKVMMGALKSGIAFTNSSVTLVHGMSRPIGAAFKIPHGLSNAFLLSTAMEFSLVANPTRFARVAIAMGANTDGLSEMDAAKISVEKVLSLVEDIQIPSMKEFGVDEELLNEKAMDMAKAAIASGSPSNNPRQVTKEEIVELYKVAYALYK